MDPYSPLPSSTWLIIGASRGIGLEFCAQLLQHGHRVLGTARSVAGSNALWALTGTPNGKNLTILECDVTDEKSVRALVAGLQRLALPRIDVCVLNAGVLEYPNRVTEITYKAFSHHLLTNTIGPLLTASSLLALSPTPHISTLVFMSSDSGSAERFRAMEDGFAAYAASKAALNQGLRHMAAELERKQGVEETVVLALHPGEVATDMAAGMVLDWEVEGIITPQESVAGMLRVIADKGRGGESRGIAGEATFWTWEGEAYPW